MIRSVLGFCIFGAVALPIAALAQQPAPTPVSSAQTQAAPEEKVRCKRYVETGSLAKVRKECHTNAEWVRIAESGREGARDFIAATTAAGTMPQ